MILLITDDGTQSKLLIQYKDGSGTTLSTDGGSFDVGEWRL